MSWLGWWRVMTLRLHSFCRALRCAVRGLKGLKLYGVHGLGGGARLEGAIIPSHPVPSRFLRPCARRLAMPPLCVRPPPACWPGCASQTAMLRRRRRWWRWYGPCCCRRAGAHRSTQT